MVRYNVARWVAVMGVIAIGVGVRASMMSGVPRGNTVDPEVLAVREGVWRAWFAGDERALGEVLPAEFMAIDGQGAEIVDRAATIAASRTFKAEGGRLVSLSFPETRSQRFGDTVILYGRYEAVMETNGQKQTMRGRLTEIFVRREGRWVHPGWHLDLQP